MHTNRIVKNKDTLMTIFGGLSILLWTFSDDGGHVKNVKLRIAFLGIYLT